MMRMKAKALLLILIVIALLSAGCVNDGTDETYTQLSSATNTSESKAESIVTSKPDSVVSSETASTVPTPDDDDLVLISDYIPDAVIDLKYATTDNFTNQIIYDFKEPSLRYGTVKKLMNVQSELNKKGYTLLVWDAYRPTYAQQKLWDICPDPKYVSDPSKGYTNHCRGNTVDVSILRSDGTSVAMPSDFDEFSKLADKDYSDVSKTAAENSQLLESVMEKCGFKGYNGEWWHYVDTVSYPIVLE